MNQKLFVWDLHGTLECGNEHAVIALSNEVLAYRGYPQRFTDGDAIRLYGLKWWEYFQQLLPQEEPHVWHALQNDCFSLSERDLLIQTTHMQPAPNSHIVLEGIDAHHEQILISNTRPNTLKVFLDRLCMARYFGDGRAFAVDGHSDHRASKVDVLRDYLGDRMYAQVIVVGDSATDMRLGSAVGGTRVLYNHAYLPRKRFPADLYTSDLMDVLYYL